jgi:hypothetical protein
MSLRKGQFVVNRNVIVIFIAVIVGMLHFLTGSKYCGPFPAFVNGYMIDILVPFAMFLVLGIAELPFLRSGIARGTFVFAIGAIVETLQYFGVPIFGRTFDLLDSLMYGIGIGLAVIFEKFILSGIPEDIPYSKK